MVEQYSEDRLEIDPMAQQQGKNVQQLAQVLRFDITGMHCAGCVKRVEDALTMLPGVESAAANLVNETVVVKALDTVDTGQLEAPLAKLGYHLSAQGLNVGTATHRKALELNTLRHQFYVSAVLTLPVFILEMGVHIWPGLHHVISDLLTPSQNQFLQFVCISLVLIFPGRQFFAMGVPALLQRSPDMNSLVAIGAFAAWAYSTAVFVAGVVSATDLFPPGTAHVYFEAAGVMVTLILLGRLLEGRAKDNANDAVRALVNLQPKTARLVRDDDITIVALKELARNDQIAILPGDTIPADGIVISGQGFVDESMLTGESTPVWKSAQEHVVGGSLNAEGALMVRVTQLGEDAVLARIIQLVEQAQASKLPVQKLVDQVTVYFVPGVIGVAILTFMVWLLIGGMQFMNYAWVSAVTVLIVACPCALGLATPTSIVAATGRAAQMGVLFRTGDALEKLSRIDLMAFDKTGTLTEGHPSIREVKLLGEYGESDVLRLVASLERLSEHPIAHAFIQQARQAEVEFYDVENFSVFPGQGIYGELDGHGVLVGSLKLMNAQSVNLQGLEDARHELEHSSQSVVCVSVDGAVVAVFEIADALKSDVPQAIAALDKLGLQLAIVSGDAQASVAHTATSLGVDTFVAEVLPEGKISALDEMVGADQLVAFVGDGINDAPVLAHADVGIALSSGTDVAMQSADVVLLGDDMPKLADAVKLSGATMTNIRQNLFWAFAYNVLLIPVAAGVVYPFTGWLLSPALAAGAMAMSSLFVVTNALRLRNLTLN